VKVFDRPVPGGDGVATALNDLNTTGNQLQSGHNNGTSAVSEVYGLPSSTEEKGEFVMISRGQRGDTPYTTAEGFKYENTAEDLRITQHRILENIDENVPSSDSRLQEYLQGGSTAQ
jgi:hypothetical protein